MLGLSVHKLALVTMDLFKCVSSPLNVSFSQWTLCGQCHLYIEPITARLSLINNKCLSHTLSRSLIVWDACKNLKRMVSGVLFNTHLLLTVPVFYTFMAITCIHEFQTQFPTSQIDIYTTAYYIASLIGWVYISLFFFLKKNMYLVGGQEKVSQCTTEDSGQLEEFSSLRLPPRKFQGSNSGHQDWQQGLSINELSLWLCIPVLTLLSLWWRHIW